MKSSVQVEDKDAICVCKVFSREVPFLCPHCGKESVLQVDTMSGKSGNYSITCPYPQCEKPSMKPLPGEIVAGPFSKE